MGKEEKEGDWWKNIGEEEKDVGEEQITREDHEGSCRKILAHSMN